MVGKAFVSAEEQGIDTQGGPQLPSHYYEALPISVRETCRKESIFVLGRIIKVVNFLSLC